MDENGLKWLYMAGNGWTLFEWLDMTEHSRKWLGWQDMLDMAGNSWNNLEIVRKSVHACIWLEMARIDVND